MFDNEGLRFPHLLLYMQVVIVYRLKIYTFDFLRIFIVFISLLCLLAENNLSDFYEYSLNSIQGSISPHNFEGW